MQAAMRPRAAAGGDEAEAEPASSFYGRALTTCGLDQRADAVAALALERLWRHIFVAG